MIYSNVVEHIANFDIILYQNAVKVIDMLSKLLLSQEKLLS